jgi:transposase
LQAKIDWTKAWFADEKIWYIDGPTYRPKVWQDDHGPAAQILGKGERNTATWVFGAISMTGLSKLITVQPHFNSAGYCEAVEQAILQSSRPHNYVLYHDRYPAHTSKQTQTWMDQHNLQTVVLPPKSPDLNPIENVWGIISREIFEGTQTYNSAESLMAAVQAAWDRVQLDSRLRRRLVGSMPERLRAVKAAKGWKTKF